MPISDERLKQRWREASADLNNAGFHGEPESVMDELRDRLAIITELQQRRMDVNDLLETVTIATGVIERRNARIAELEASQPRYKVGDRVWAVIDFPPRIIECYVQATPQEANITVVQDVPSPQPWDWRLSLKPTQLHPDRASAEAAVSEVKP